MHDILINRLENSVKLDETRREKTNHNAHVISKLFHT